MSGASGHRKGFSPSPKLVLTIVILVLVAVLGLSYRTTVAYTPTEEGLTFAYRPMFVVRRAYHVEYADIERVEVLPKAPAMRREFGASLFGVHIGRYSAANLGTFTAIISNDKRPLLYVAAKAGSYLISPDDAAALKAEIEQHLTRWILSTSTATWMSRPPAA